MCVCVCVCEGVCVCNIYMYCNIMYVIYIMYNTHNMGAVRDLTNIETAAPILAYPALPHPPPTASTASPTTSSHRPEDALHSRPVSGGAAKRGWGGGREVGG